jgi:hypothetical protein
MRIRRETLFPGLCLALLWLILFATVGAQGPGRDPGSMPQSAVFGTSLSFARILPFIIALGILGGLYRGRSQRRQTADEPLRHGVLRHARADIGLHWLNALGFLIGLGTAAMLLRWLARSLSLQTIYVLHYVGAGLITYAVSSFATYALVGGHSGLLPTRRDIPAALGELVSYLGIFGERGAFGIRLPTAIARPIARLFVTFGIRKPKQVGKYLATEKALSLPVWAVLVGLILATGLVKTLRYAWPIPTGFVAAATWVHDISSVAIVVWLFVHVASTALVPRNWPLLKSMVTSRVSEEYVKQHHPVWYRELSAGGQAPPVSGKPRPIPTATAAANQPTAQ